METCFTKPKSSIKNTLIRSQNHSSGTSSNQSNHPEIPYILKYSPKYYRSLNLASTPNRSLLSKVKKIKKLKKFTGVFEDNLPQKLWFNLLANTRKEIEEFPEFSPEFKPKRLIWKSLNTQKVKFFPNVKRIFFGKGKFYYHDYRFPMSTRNDSQPIKELFARYLWSMRPENLEITVQRQNYNQMEWILRKLKRMNGLLRGLETLRMTICNEEDVNVTKLLENKNVLAHLTDLSLSEKFDSNFIEIPQICKNIKSLSLNLGAAPDKQPDFLRFLASIHNLNQLQSLDLVWPIHIRHFWSHFKPQASLKNLKVGFDLRNKGLLGESLKELEEYWTEIKDFDCLEFEIKSNDADDMNFVRFFITAMLKKISKLGSFNCSIQAPVVDDGFVKYEPFLVHEVGHLYESLESFEYTVNNSQSEDDGKFDFEVMKQFKNLKRIKLKGVQTLCENVGDMVNFLQDNQKGAMLELSSSLLYAMELPDWVKSIIRNIAKVKRLDENLKVRIELSLKGSNLAMLVKEVCEILKLIKTRKDIMVSLTLDEREENLILIEKEISEQYSDIQNLVIKGKDERKIKKNFVPYRKIEMF